MLAIGATESQIPIAEVILSQLPKLTDDTYSALGQMATNFQLKYCAMRVHYANQLEPIPHTAVAAQILMVHTQDQHRHPKQTHHQRIHTISKWPRTSAYGEILLPRL